MSVSKIPHRVGTVSTVALFLSNIRLLNLDTLADWPDVNASTFDTKDVSQNQKRRISCVEWLLYRLFQILDPVLTREKLQPFFPPLEPLQSINLRAALFRCFNELKKNGVLGREAVVRKTMLDECKGEKFEELLLMFSTVVLKKRVQATRHSRPPPVAQRLAIKDGVNTLISATMTPLILAHRSSLQAKLERREESKTSFRHFCRAMREYEDKLSLAHHEIETSQHQYKDSLFPDDMADLKNAVQLNWAGRIQDSHLLCGDAPIADELQESSYDHSYAHFQATGCLPAHGTDESLLTRLDSALQVQNERLAQWKLYSEQMRIDSPAPKDTVGESTKAALFSAHREIRFGSGILRQPESSQEPQSDSRYDGIIHDMNYDLSKVTEKRSRQHNADPEGEATTITKRSDSSHQPLKISDIPPLSSTAGTISLRAPAQGARLDFFSPVKGAGQSAVSSCIIHRSDLTSSSLPHGYVSAIEDQTGHRSPNSTTALERHNGDQLPSMNSLLEGESDGPRHINITVAEEAPSSGLEAMKIAPRLSLAERARQSIATGSSIVEARRRQERKTRPTALYPVNQFETPVKTACAPNLLEEVPEAPQPETKVDEKDEPSLEDDEYASVFKSRPKIALSPVFSPLGNEMMRSGFDGMEGVYEHQESPVGVMHR